MIDVFKRLGVPEADAAISADVLISADLRGIESHGVWPPALLLRPHQTRAAPAVTRFEIMREGPSTALVDGHHGMDVIGVRAMRLAMDQGARLRHGIVVGGVRQLTHYGIRILSADGGQRGDGRMSVDQRRALPSRQHFRRTRCSAPTRSPLAPPPTREDRPFLYDAATSIVQRGTFEVLHRGGGAGGSRLGRGARRTPRSDPGEVLDKLRTASGAPSAGGAGRNLGGIKDMGWRSWSRCCRRRFRGAFMYGLIGFDEKGARPAILRGALLHGGGHRAFPASGGVQKDHGDHHARTARCAEECPGRTVTRLGRKKPRASGACAPRGADRAEFAGRRSSSCNRSSV